MISLSINVFQTCVNHFLFIFVIATDVVITLLVLALFNLALTMINSILLGISEDIPELQRLQNNFARIVVKYFPASSSSELYNLHCMQVWQYILTRLTSNFLLYRC